MTLQEMFNELVLGKPLVLQGQSASEYNSLRIMLVKKYKKYQQEMETLGFGAGLDETYLKASFTKATAKIPCSRSEFSVAHASCRKTHKYSYNVVDY